MGHNVPGKPRKVECHEYDCGDVGVAVKQEGACHIEGDDRQDGNQPRHSRSQAPPIGVKIDRPNDLRKGNDGQGSSVGHVGVGVLPGERVPRGVVLHR